MVRNFTFIMEGDKPELCICGYSLSELIKIQKAAEDILDDPVFKNAERFPSFVDARCFTEESEYDNEGRMYYQGGQWIVEPFASDLEPDYHYRESIEVNELWARLEELEQSLAEAIYDRDNPPPEIEPGEDPFKDF